MGGYEVELGKKEVRGVAERFPSVLEQADDAIVAGRAMDGDVQAFAHRESERLEDRRFDDDAVAPAPRRVVPTDGHHREVGRR